jgi:hypothetical protein
VGASPPASASEAGSTGSAVGGVECSSSLLEFERVERWPRVEDGLLAGGEVVRSGPAEELLEDEAVVQAYLG